MKKDELKKLLGQRLKAAAKNAGVTGIKLAEMLNVQPETVSRHMTGRTELSITDAMRYAELLGIHPCELLFEQTKVPIYGYLHDFIPRGSTRVVEPIKDEDNPPYVTTPFMFERPTVAAIFSLRNTSSYRLPNVGMITTQRVAFFETNNIKDRIVTPDCFGTPCLCNVYEDDEERFRIRVVYPEANSTTYTTQDGDRVRANITLRWACPILSTHWQVELSRIQAHNVRTDETDFTKIT